MKFVIPAFALIAASAVYANGVDDIRSPLPFKAVLNTDSSTSSTNVSTECKLQFQPYLECFEDSNSVNVESHCPQYSSEKCEQVYKDPQGILTDCKDSPYIMELVDEFIGTNLVAYKFACLKDESGNECPFSKLALKLISTMTQSEYEEMKSGTCSSKICQEATYDIVCDKELLKLTNKKELCDTLTTCKDVKSSALSLKMGSGLLITLGLFLFSLY